MTETSAVSDSVRFTPVVDGLSRATRLLLLAAVLFASCPTAAAQNRDEIHASPADSLAGRFSAQTKTPAGDSISASQRLGDDPADRIVDTAVVSSEAVLQQTRGLERRMLRDGLDGRWDEFSYLEAALIAGGITDRKQLDAYRARFETHAQTLRETGVERLPVRERAQAVFEYMYAHITTSGYRLQASSPSRVLDDGRFNCVTGSLIFRYLGESVGLVVTNVQLPSHAYCRVATPEGPLVVETTCARWFELIKGRDSAEVWRELRDRWLKRSGTESDSLEQARAVTPVELVGTIYYNLGVDLLLDGRFAEAAAANRKSLLLDPDNRTAQENLLATLNNWAISLASQEDISGAIRLLEEGLRCDNRYPPLVRNYLQLQRRRVSAFCDQGRFDDARRLVEHAGRLLPPTSLAELVSQVESRERMESAVSF